MTTNLVIQEKMYKLIEKEINQTVEAGKEIRTVNFDKAKQVAKMLAALATDKQEPHTLTSQYIVNVKNIYNS